MVTVSHQAGGNTGCFTTDGGPVAIERVKQHIVLLRARHHKCPTVSQGVEVPEVAVVVVTQAVQPTKNLWFNQRPFGYLTKVFCPEMDALRIRNLGGYECVCFGIEGAVHEKNPCTIIG